MAMTRIEAANELVESIGEWPYAALDSTGTWPTKTYGGSIIGQAERTLDRVAREVLTRGTIDNTLRNQSVTPATGAGPYEYTFAGSYANALKVQGWGPDEARTFSISAGKLFDANNGTTLFTTNTAIKLHIIINKDFTDLSSEIQQEIVKEAKLAFQRYWGESNSKDIQISQELDKARAGKSSSMVKPGDPINKLDGIGPFGPALTAQPSRGN